MDFHKPELKDHYAAVLGRLRGWVALLAGWLEDASPENTPVGTKRWSQINQRFERFDGTVWQPLAKRYRIDVDTLDGLDAGNNKGQIAVNNGQLNQNLNAEQLGGQAAAWYASQRAVDAAHANAESRVAKAGDTMSGPLILSGDADQPLQAVTKQQLDAVQQGAIPVDGSVTEPKLADFAVSTRTLEDEAVGPEKIRDAAIQSRHLTDGAVRAGKIANRAVDTNKLADRSVTAGKLAYGAVVGNLGYTPARSGSATCQQFDTGWTARTDWNAGPRLNNPYVMTGIQNVSFNDIRIAYTKLRTNS